MHNKRAAWQQLEILWRSAQTSLEATFCSGFSACRSAPAKHEKCVLEQLTVVKLVSLRAHPSAPPLMLCFPPQKASRHLEAIFAIKKADHRGARLRMGTGGPSQQAPADAADGPFDMFLHPDGGRTYFSLPLTYRKQQHMLYLWLSVFGASVFASSKLSW